jgi:hypothetical protein
MEVLLPPASHVAILEYMPLQGVILSFKLVRGHDLSCTWAKSKEVRPTHQVSHRDVPVTHGNLPASLQPCLGPQPPDLSFPHSFLY